MLISIVICLILCQSINSYHNPHFIENRTTIVHLFEWKWNDIARECEEYLGPNGYAGVQVSPVTENIIVKNRPWYERYQPISYLLITRSGNEAQLRDMVKRCNNVGVRIYVDAVFNHMAALQDQNIGTGNSTADILTKTYPAVPYSTNDFHPTCEIKNYQNTDQVRNCELQGLRDLDQSKPHVRERIVNYLNHLIEMGVAGFRIDAAKHMWPKDLEAIYGQLNDLKMSFQFPEHSRPFLYQEVIDLGGNEGISRNEYTKLGVVTEFLVSKELGAAFRGKNKLRWLATWGPAWNLMDSKNALVFIDNHDNQRGHGGGGNDVVTYQMEQSYKLANAFMLAHPFGIAQVMSSFNITGPSHGPPADNFGNIQTPQFDARGYCSTPSGWVCEHRWREIANMVEFRNIANGAPLTHWWDNQNNQIAFGRDNKAFLVINNEQKALIHTLRTGLPAGSYCNVFVDTKPNENCNGRPPVIVDKDGKINVNLQNGHDAIAIHIGAKM